MWGTEGSKGDSLLCLKRGKKNLHMLYNKWRLRVNKLTLLLEVSDYLVTVLMSVFPTRHMNPEIFTIAGFENSLIEIGISFKEIKPASGISISACLRLSTQAVKLVKGNCQQLHPDCAGRHRLHQP